MTHISLASWELRRRGPHREALTVRPSRPDFRDICLMKRPDAQAVLRIRPSQSSTLRGTVVEFARRRVCRLDWVGWRSSNGGGGGASRRCSSSLEVPGEEMRSRGELRQRSGPMGIALPPPPPPEGASGPRPRARAGERPGRASSISSRYRE